MATTPTALRGPEHAPPTVSDRFNRYASRLTDVLGSFWALVWSVLLVVIWALTGPIFNFSDTWQLFINTSTTVITFWMVFVIQNSANRDAKAIHLKLDEIIRATQGARNELITLEEEPEHVVAQTARGLVPPLNEDAGSATAPATRSAPSRSAAPRRSAPPAPARQTDSRGS